MKSKHLKVIFLFTAIIILSFHYNFKALQKGIQRYNRKELDQITVYEKRFIELKEFLQNHLVVGYVSDYDDNTNEDGIAYTMTQYVLAPIILVRGIKRNFIIGNFHGAKPNIKAYEKENLSLIRDFGNGVILFERMDN
jgi:flagellar biosynthesis protein FliP